MANTQRGDRGQGRRVGYVGVTKKESRAKVWYHADRLGSIRLMTNASGAEVKDYDYRAFGSTQSQSGTMLNERGFTGHITDAEVNLIYMGARYYNASLGRFISADTIVASFANPQSLNRYSYVYNNPVNTTDPTGHKPCDYSLDGGVCQNKPPSTKSTKTNPSTNNGSGTTASNATSANQMSGAGDKGSGNTPESPNTTAQGTVAQVPNNNDWNDYYNYGADWTTVGIPGIDPPWNPDVKPRPYHYALMAIGFSPLVVIGGFAILPEAVAAAPAASAGTAAAEKIVEQVTIYSEKVLNDIAEAEQTGDLYHGFPIQFDRIIIENGYRVAVGEKYVEYVLQGSVNNTEGVYQIGVNIFPAAEIIVHRFFESFH